MRTTNVILRITCIWSHRGYLCDGFRLGPVFPITAAFYHILLYIFEFEFRTKVIFFTEKIYPAVYSCHQKTVEMGMINHTFHNQPFTLRKSRLQALIKILYFAKVE